MRCDNCGRKTPKPQKIVSVKRSTTPQTYAHVAKYYCEHCYATMKKKVEAPSRICTGE